MFYGDLPVTPGFQVEVTKFFSYLLTLALTSITATSMAFAISARVNVTAVANLLIAMLFVFSMVRKFVCELHLKSVMTSIW